MIIAVSDVHLGQRGLKNRELFSNFLDFSKACHPDHLVLLGDIIDFWRGGLDEVVLTNEQQISDIQNLQSNSKIKVHYVVGNHDLYLRDLASTHQFPIDVEPNMLNLDDKGVTYYFLHGYHLEVWAKGLSFQSIEDYEEMSTRLCFSSEVTGRVMSLLWKVVAKPVKEKIEALRKEILRYPEHRRGMPEIERLATSSFSRNFFLGLRKDERLVFGHTHRPFIEENVANTGSLQKVESNPKIPKNTYLGPTEK